MNLGAGEVMVILLVALLVLGPTRLPEAARQVGKAMRTIRQVSTGFQDEMRHAIEDSVEADAAKEAGVAYTPASRPGVQRDEDRPDEGGPTDLTAASDDAEAQTLGWPCAGTHRAVLGLMVARGMADGHRFKIVPRGSTVATAGAADIHDRHLR